MIQIQGLDPVKCDEEVVGASGMDMDRASLDISIIVRGGKT